MCTYLEVVFYAKSVYTVSDLEKMINVCNIPCLIARLADSRRRGFADFWHREIDVFSKNICNVYLCICFWYRIPGIMFNLSTSNSQMF